VSPQARGLWNPQRSDESPRRRATDETTRFDFLPPAFAGLLPFTFSLFPFFTFSLFTFLPIIEILFTGLRE
jgi:hypothetical protein